MRKSINTLIIFALTILYVSCTPLHAQEYGKYKLTIIGSNFKRIGKLPGIITVSVWHNGQICFECTDHRVRPFPSINFPSQSNPFVKIFSLNEYRKPNALSFYGFLKGISGMNGISFSELHWNSSLPYVHIDRNHADNGKDFFLDMKGTFSIELIPLSIKLHYFEGNGTGSEIFENRCLYDIKNITLKATEGFVRATYKWQYKLSDDDRWKDMPSEFYGSSSITFNGLDLFDML